MEDYTIDVSRIEELQTLKDVDELETIFSRAKSAIVNGAKVLLVRKNAIGVSEKFEEMEYEDELENYKKRVFKYLN